MKSFKWLQKKVEFARQMKWEQFWLSPSWEASSGNVTPCIGRENVPQKVLADESCSALLLVSGAVCACSLHTVLTAGTGHSPGPSTTTLSSIGSRMGFVSSLIHPALEISVYEHTSVDS